MIAMLKLNFKKYWTTGETALQRKATGSDVISADALKLDIKVTANMLHILFRKIYEIPNKCIIVRLISG